ncbi:hypothetical protein JF66_08475 [Cryobacterium sp. MLB-32]|uniref:hypothetical protein n=1 Tax=Cryobacterium sp. MLB-32 TaxID=1529318 RepID=UPI0004E79CDE|nr:hypothetical protein [Cryobacterium sp. MLB-32]KFF59834.1 hypothetical protein JF66_08475 [Cryobacterium sp. MLB-32]
MQAHRLTINSDSFHLPAGYDVAGLKSALAAAAHHGGGFVDLVSVSGSHVALLVTPNSTVKFETIPPQEAPDESTDLATGAPTFDDDYGLE